MNYERLKKAVEQIDMTDEMKTEIIKNCQIKMSKKTKMIKGTPIKRTAAAVVFICICAVGAAAMGYRGIFKDVKDIRGAVIGTEYEYADNEITINACFKDNSIILSAVLIDSGVAPYMELETLGLYSYKIVDEMDNTVAGGEQTAFFKIEDARAEIIIPLQNMDVGKYRLVISSFAGGKKADQPLIIKGNWECEVTKEN